MLARVIPLQSSRKRAFILITQGLLNKIKIRRLFFLPLLLCPLLEWVKPVVIWGAPKQLCAVHSVHVPSSWVRNEGGGRCGRQEGENHLSLPLIFEHRQQMTNEKCYFHSFPCPDVELKSRARQRNRGMMKSRTAEGRCFLVSPGSCGVHLPTTNPPWWIDEAVTDSALQELYLGLEHGGADWNTLSSHIQ